MSNLPSPTDLIRVAFMSSPRDLKMARLLGWYRIPLRTAPKVMAVDCLAFHQPATFGENHRWCIEFFAPVLGHELVTRAELLNAQNIADLSGQDEERQVLWRALRERALPAQQYGEAGPPELHLADDLLASLGMLGGDDLLPEQG